jgi:hypothetical protein
MPFVKSNDRERKPSKNLTPVLAQALTLLIVGILPLWAAIKPNQTTKTVTKEETSSTKVTPTALQESVSLEKYIDVRITSEVDRKSGEVEKKSLEAAKDEIAKVKAELSKDVVMPVIFAIASIFGAFALKDIVHFFLEKDEKKNIRAEIKDDIERILKYQIVPDIFKEKSKLLAQDIKNLERYTSWLEHQMLSILITQTVQELSQYPIPQEAERDFLLAIEKLGNRSIITLEKSSKQFHEPYLEQIKKLEEGTLKAALNSTSKDFGLKAVLLRNSDASTKVIEKEETYEGESIFQAQMGLLRIKLSNLQFQGKSDTELASLLRDLNKAIMEDPSTTHQKNVAAAAEWDS